jgi:serine/threonine protein phosphatase PrpC
MFNFENFKKSPKEKAQTIALEIKAEKDPVKKAKLIRNLNLEISRWKTGLSRADLANTAIIKEINDLIASTEIFTDEEIGAFTDHNAIIAGMTNKVKEIEPANKWPWGKKEALKPSPITPEEEGLENFETFEIFAAADSKQIPDGSHENQDAHFEDPETGIFILADGVSNSGGGDGGVAARWFVEEAKKELQKLNKNKKLKTAEDWESAIKLMIEGLNTRTKTLETDKFQGSTTFNIIKMVEVGDKLKAVVVTCGDSLVLHQKSSDKKSIELINNIDSAGIIDLRLQLVDDDSTKDRAKELQKVAENLLFKYPEKLDDDGKVIDFEESDLTPQEKEVLEFWVKVSKIDEAFVQEEIVSYNDTIKSDPAKYTHLNEITEMTVNQFGLRRLRRYADLCRAFPSKYDSYSTSNIIELLPGDKLINGSDGMENIGYEKIREILSEDDLSANVKNLIEFGQKTKKDDCTVQVLEIKAKTPPVAPSSPDTLTPEEEIIVDEIEKFVIDGESPKPEEARYIYEVVKNSGKFEDSKGDVDLILIESSLTSKFNSEIFSFEGDQIDKWINSI